jgi:hypothetical protein
MLLIISILEAVAFFEDIKLMERYVFNDSVSWCQKLLENVIGNNTNLDFISDEFASMRQWVVMKQDHVLEKVRNSFRDAAKKVPLKKQNIFSEGVNSIARTYKKSRSFDARSESQHHLDELYYFDTSMTDMVAQHRVPSMASSSSLSKLKSDNSSGEFYDFDYTPSYAGTESDDDNDKAEIMHDTGGLGVSCAVSPRMVDDRSSGMKSELNLYNSQEEQLRLPNFANVGKSQGLDNQSYNEMEDETLEDLLCAVDSALHWKASTPETISLEYSDNQIGKMNVDEIANVYPHTAGHQRNITPTPRFDRRFSETHDSNFIGMIDQVLGPLDDDVAQKYPTTSSSFTSDPKRK